MDDFDQVALDFERKARFEGGAIYASVVIYVNNGLETVHVNNPPKDSGFEPGREMSPQEFIALARAYRP